MMSIFRIIQHKKPCRKQQQPVVAFGAFLVYFKIQMKGFRLKLRSKWKGSATLDPKCKKIWLKWVCPRLKQSIFSKKSRKSKCVAACNIIEHKRITESNATVENMFLLIKAAILNNTSQWQRLPSPLRILPLQQSNKYIREGFGRGYWNITWTYIAIYYCIWDKETGPRSCSFLFDYFGHRQHQKDKRGNKNSCFNRGFFCVY